MKEHSISSYFINNDIFIKHFLSYEDISQHDFNDMILSIDDSIQIHSKKMNDLFNVDIESRASINILPYFFITDVYIDSSRRQLFYLFLNKYVSSIINNNDPVISSCFNIDSKFLVLCYIYMVQYIFL